MILKLFIISMIITLIFDSGFVDEIDEKINRHIRFYHLPKPFSCNLCMCFWCCLAYVIATGNISLLNVLICLCFATLTDVERALIGVVKNNLLWLIEKLYIK